MQIQTSQTDSVTAREKLIVALDVATADEARAVIEALRGQVGMFKIGLQLFTAAGASFVREVVALGERVFLDLKFHDIPNTVAAASVEAVKMGVAMFNLHAVGGGEMLRRAADAVNETVAREGVRKPLVIGVTVLTSAHETTLNEVGIAASPAEQVVRLARITEEAGLDGVVASPVEIAIIRATVKNENFKLVTPGVRMPDSAVENDDQKRVLTPAEAVGAGADHIVVGRPILRSADPAKAVRDIIAQIENR